MRTVRCLMLFALPVLLAAQVRADTDVLDLDPLSEKDLSYFKIEGEGEWKTDDKSDDLHTLIVCPRAKDDTSLLFAKRKFAQGFLVSMEMMTGVRNKKLEVYVVPEKGDRILVPLPKRMMNRRGWHDFLLHVEKGEAKAKIGDEWEEAVEVPTDQELTFAFTLPKGCEAAFKKMKVRFLVVSEEQADAEEGFVRIFDGKSLDGWRQNPKELEGSYKLADERIEGKHIDPNSRIYASLEFADAVFRDFVLRFKASSNTQGLTLMARQPRSQEEQDQCIIGVANYFTRDRDWNEVTWDVKGTTAQLRIDGRLVLNHTAPHDRPLPVMFLLPPGGNCTLRDIQVKGQPAQAGAFYRRYAGESGAGGGGATAGGGDFGGRGGASGAQGPATRPLFDGKTLDDWRVDPPLGVWSVAMGRILGITKDQPGVLGFKKWVFPEYRLEFKVEKGSKGVTFVASAIRDKPPVEVKLKEEWLTEPWNAFEAVKLEGKFTLKVNGKEVHSGAIHNDAGAIGWKVEANSALGIKDIVWNRP